MEGGATIVDVGGLVTQYDRVYYGRVQANVAAVVPFGSKIEVCGDAAVE